MRGIRLLASSVFEPRNLVLSALLGVSAWAAINGLMPTGPKVTEAVEAKPVAEATGPSVSDRNVTRAVTFLMKREHLSKHPLDDEISRRGFDLLSVEDRRRLLAFLHSL